MTPQTAAAEPNGSGEALSGSVVGAVQAGRSSTPAQPVTENLLDIVVRGNPVGQGRISFMGKGRAVHSNAATLKPWREVIGYVASNHMGDRPPYDGPVMLTAAFTVARPASAPKSRRHPDRRPDLSHLVRAVEDALSGIVYADDARIVALNATKYYPSDDLFWALPYPGVHIGVWPVL